jgi:hypothetical protein
MQKRKHVSTSIHWLLIVVLLILVDGAVKAQDYKEKITQDSIKISYKWRKSKKLKKDSPYVLMLQLENLSSTKVTVSFMVRYYWKAQLHSGSKLMEYCIKSGKKIKGKKWNLAFYSKNFTMDDYLDPMFSWIIDDVKAEKNELCNPCLKLEINPAYPQGNLR